MKIKHTKNGNVKLVMSMEEAQHLKTMVDSSHFIDYHTEGLKAKIERTSWDLFEGLRTAGITSCE